MDSGDQVEFDLPGVVRIYKSGRVERFYTVTLPPAPAGDPAYKGVASKDVVLHHAANIPARIYLPGNVVPGTRLPVVLFFHGGAFMVNSAASPIYHAYAASLATAAPAVVVSADYRLAPEHPVPAAYHDAFAALRAVVTACSEESDCPEPWLAAHGDISRIVIVGDSCGANMAHNTAIRLMKDGLAGYGDMVSGVALLHPYFWGKTPLGGEPVDAGYRGQFERTWEVVCGRKFSVDHPCINPMSSPEEWRRLGCRRVLVTTAEQCWFVERARAYAEGVKKCGWDGDIEFFETKGEGHEYFIFKPDCDKAVNELAVVANFIRRC